MKLLISDKEEEVDEGDDEEMMRPSAPLGRPDHTGKIRGDVILH